MAGLSEVLAAPGVRPCIELLVPPTEDAEAASVTLLEDPALLADAAAGAVAILTADASESAASYRFDIAVRLARSRAVCALVLSGESFSSITPTAAAIAERAGIAVARTAEGTDLADLCVRITHEIAGGAEAALDHAFGALRVALARPRAPVDELVAAAAAELGRPLELRSSADAGEVAAPVLVDGKPEQWVCAGPAHGNSAMATELAVQIIAGQVGRLIESERRSQELPIQSRAELLTELLGTRGHDSTQLVRRARALDIPIDGWHVAVRLELDPTDDQGGTDELAAFEARRAIARIALETARSSGGTWHTARDGPAIILLRMFREDPGAKAVMEVVRIAERVLKRIERRLEMTVARCGVGSLHSGATGLASTAAEARAGVAAARAAGHANVATAFDSMGLRRTLLEWYASDSARDAVTQILAPLDELQGQRGETALRTLQTYLDHRGSLTQTAQSLGLHRNAVAYRIKKIFSLLEADLDNPDDWLLLQLACRSRNLA
jgi:sugar diacid utilization regulator